jgi:hypothetical protein
MVAFGVIFAVVLVLIVVAAIRGGGALCRAGLHPLGVQAEIAARLANSELLRADRPIEQRLAELDDLR